MKLTRKEMIELLKKLVKMNLPGEFGKMATIILSKMVGFQPLTNVELEYVSIFVDLTNGQDEIDFVARAVELKKELDDARLEILRLRNLPAKIEEVIKTIIKEVPTTITKIVEKIVEVPVPQIITKVIEVPIEKVVEKIVKVPVTTTKTVIKEVKVGMTPDEMLEFLMTPAGQALAQEANEALELKELKEEILKMMEAEGISVAGGVKTPRGKKEGSKEIPANDELLDKLCTKENLWFIKRWKTLCHASYTVALIDGEFTAISAFRKEMKTFKTEAEAVKYVEFLKGAKARDHFRRVKTRFNGASEAELNKRFKNTLNLV